MIKHQDFSETKINRNLRYSHENTNCVTNTDLINWVSKHSWEMLLSEFSQADKIIACPRTIICNTCEQNNIICEILNAGYDTLRHVSVG